MTNTHVTNQYNMSFRKEFIQKVHVLLQAGLFQINFDLKSSYSVTFCPIHLMTDSVFPKPVTYNMILPKISFKNQSYYTVVSKISFYNQRHATHFCANQRHITDFYPSQRHTTHLSLSQRHITNFCPS